MIQITKTLHRDVKTLIHQGGSWPDTSATSTVSNGGNGTTCCW